MIWKKNFVEEFTGNFFEDILIELDDSISYVPAV